MSRNRARRRVERKVEVERLEEKVVMDGGGGGGRALIAHASPLARGIHPAGAAAEAGAADPAGHRAIAEAKRGGAGGKGAPGSPLTIAGRFNPADPTYVTFTGKHGQSIRMDATGVTAGSVTVPIPIVLNPRTLKPTAGTFSVQVQQQGPGAGSVAAISRFRITRAASTHSAGTLAQELIARTTAALNQSIQNYQKIGSASGGKINVAPLVAQLQQEVNAQAQMASLISRAMSGQKVVLGRTPKGKTIVLDRKSLPMIDELLSASVPGMGVVAVRGGAQPADDFGGDDASSLEDDLSSTSEDLGDGGGSDAGAVDWYTSEAISYDDSEVLDTYTGDDLGGDSSNQVDAYQQDVNDSGLGQTEQQDAGALEQEDSGSDGSAISGDVSTTVGAFTTADGGANSVNAQIAQNMPPSGAPAIVNTLPGNLITTTSGGSVTFLVRLNSQPTADVVVPLRLDNAKEGKLSTSVLTFTPQDWYVPQAVTVTGQDDPRDTSEIHYFVLIGQATSGDPSYNGMDDQSVPLINERSSQAPTVNVTGTWTGTLTQPDNSSAPTWQETLTLTQSGSTVTGTRTSQAVGTSITVTWIVTGTISGNTLQLQDQSIQSSSGGSWIQSTIVLTASGNGMSGTWQGDGDSGSVQLTLGSSPNPGPGPNPGPSSQTYVGNFTGTVENSPADGDNDPEGTYTDSYGGQMKATLAANSGDGYTLTISGHLQTAGYPNDGQEFVADPDGSITVTDLGNISFSFTMGDGNCDVRGGIANGVFSGTWTFVPTDSSSDQSDSGSGTFALHLS